MTVFSPLDALICSANPKPPRRNDPSTNVSVVTVLKAPCGKFNFADLCSRSSALADLCFFAVVLHPTTDTLEMPHPPTCPFRHRVRANHPGLFRRSTCRSRIPAVYLPAHVLPCMLASLRHKQGHGRSGGPTSGKGNGGVRVIVGFGAVLRERVFCRQDGCRCAIVVGRSRAAFELLS